MTDENQILPPEMSIKRTPVFLHKEDIERVLMDKLPGFVSDISQGSQWPGCRFIEFRPMGQIVGLQKDMLDYYYERTPDHSKLTPVEGVNRFFELFANYMLVRFEVTTHASIIIEYTSMLDNDDTQDLQEVSAEIRKAMNKKRAERKVAQREADAKAKAEHDELITLGRTAKDQNIIEKNREYINEIHDLRATVKELKRKAGK